MTTAVAKGDRLTRLLQTVEVQRRFEGMLKDKAPGFISSIINTVNSNKQLAQLANTNPVSIIRSAAVAAALDLPIDRNLGFAWIVPYGGEAQFQMGYKGYIQLALRTSQYKKLNGIMVYENQFKSWNPLTEDLDADFTIVGTGKAVGIATYFELVNGFSKVCYWPMEVLLAHGKRYSKSFNSKDSAWKTHPDEMCLKTAIKMMLSKWGILSTEMQTAVKADQAVVRKDNLDDVGVFSYPDGMGESELRDELSPFDTVVDAEFTVNDAVAEEQPKELSLEEALDAKAKQG